MTPADDGLYPDTAVLVFYWCLVWLAAHFLAWPLWKRRRVFSLIFNPTPIERYRRRLCRSQVYCALAVMGGARLLLGCRWAAEDLLYAFSAEHQIFFSMATGHWIVSVWEDSKNWTFLRGGLSRRDTENGADPSGFLWLAYLVHHVVAAVAFVAAMNMHVCTGLAAFGLVFEIPVLYMNHREFAVYADSVPDWFRDERQVELFWADLRFWFKVARGVPSFVYLYSIFFWYDELSKLSPKESWTYHGMATFFTILNFALLVTYLEAWEKKDMELASSVSCSVGEELEEKFRELLHVEDEAQSKAMDKKEEEAAVAENLPEVVKQPLKDVTLEMFENKAKSEDGELWVEIDNVAYNLTELLGNHPGGDNILRKFAFKDASKAFHKAKHSMKAKMQMQMYCIGPMKRELKEYRIFEQSQELKDLFYEFRGLALTTGMACWLFPYSFISQVSPLSEAAGPTSKLLAPGLAWACGAAALLMSWRKALNPANWTTGALAVAGAFVSFLVGLELAMHPARGNLPSGLEIGAAVIFVVEEVLLHMKPEGYKGTFWRRLAIAAATLLLSWRLRGVGLDMLFTDTEPALGGLLLGLSTPILCRLGSAHEEEMIQQCFSGLAIAMLLSLLTLCYLLVPTADSAGFQQLANHAWASWTTNELIFTAMTFSAGLGTIALMVNQAFAFSSMWASRTMAIILSVGVCFGSGGFGYRWLSWVSCFTLIGTLGYRNNVALEMLQKQGKLDEVPMHRVCGRAAWEMFYLVLGTFIWQVGQQTLKKWINSLMPQELQFYAPWIPFFELGEDVDVGVAAYYATKEGVQSQVGPHHFVCSVRHMDTAHADGQRDLQLHRNTAQDMWTKCKDTSTGGLIANVNCFFPRLSGSTHCKEINLSGWKSEEAAKAWSEKHSGLPGVQSHLSSRGQMRTLGSMQAYLKTHGEIRHQDRCSNCTRLVESEKLGEKAPPRCRYCGKKNYGYPFF